MPAQTPARTLAPLAAPSTSLARPLATAVSSMPPVQSLVAPAPTYLPTATPSHPPTSAPTGTLEPRWERLRFVPALGGRVFARPVELFPWPEGGLAIAEKTGEINLYHIDKPGRGLLDLRTVTDAGLLETGLLSAATDPEFEEFQFLYVYYWVNHRALGGKQRTRLSRFPVVHGKVQRSQELILVEVFQPHDIHNGGAIRFGPDGMLYLGIGDGGWWNAVGDSQRMNNLLGTIIRIDIRDASEQQPYRIPADNPAIDDTDARPEIYAWGLRNPWRMAFDAHDGTLWAGDVGAGEYEEINIIEAGGNYGWNFYEGKDCIAEAEYCATLEHIPPVTVVPHSQGCAIIGGVVYRGAAIPWLQGTYLFGDYCTHRVWALTHDGNADWEMRHLTRLERPIGSFGVDAAGEVYALTFGGPVMRLVEAEE